jgi:hypothetical protein
MFRLLGLIDVIAAHVIVVWPLATNKVSDITKFKSPYLNLLIGQGVRISIILAFNNPKLFRMLSYMVCNKIYSHIRQSHMSRLSHSSRFDHPHTNG